MTALPTWTAALSALRVNAVRRPSPRKDSFGTGGEIAIGRSVGWVCLLPEPLLKELSNSMCFREKKMNPGGMELGSSGDYIIKTCCIDCQK